MSWAGCPQSRAKGLRFAPKIELVWGALWQDKLSMLHALLALKTAPKTKSTLLSYSLCSAVTEGAPTRNDGEAGSAYV